MATTFYASLSGNLHRLGDVDHAGTASTSTDVTELRMGNGTYAPSRTEVITAIKNFKRWIIQGGVDQLGANLPLPNSQA